MPKAAVTLESTDSTALPEQQANLRRLTERRCASYQITPPGSGHRGITESLDN
jgi:hypothetical protein